MGWLFNRCTGRRPRLYGRTTTRSLLFLEACRPRIILCHKGQISFQPTLNDPLSPLWKVDNLCRNPPLVVLVPASQEAEPLDITVTLHPRAAQAQARVQSPLPHCGNETGAGAYGPPANHQPSPGRPPEPPSPSSIGSRSAAASPLGRGQGNGGGGGAPGAQHQQLAAKGLAATFPRTVGGFKGRARLKIHGGGKARLTRTGSAAGGRVAPTTPPAPDMRHVASWDGTENLATSVPTGWGKPWAEEKGDAVASPTAVKREKAGFVGTTATGGGGAEGVGGGGGIFASLSLSRRRSVHAMAGRSGGDGLNRKPRHVPAALSARERVGGSGKGRRAGVVRGGLSSAPPVAQASYKMFFGDTDDGGEESGSSHDEDDDPLLRRSFIRVACTARTSYKLFSSDPQVCWQWCRLR